MGLGLLKEENLLLNEIDARRARIMNPTLACQFTLWTDFFPSLSLCSSAERASTATSENSSFLGQLSSFMQNQMEGKTQCPEGDCNDYFQLLCNLLYFMPC